MLIGRHQVGDWLLESLIRVLCQDPCDPGFNAGIGRLTLDRVLI